MSTEKAAQEQIVPFWKAFLIALAILVVLIAWILFGRFVLKLEKHWVGLIAITLFGGLYNNNLADAPKIYVGSAVGLVMGFLLWYLPAKIGPAGLVVMLIVIGLLLGALIAKKIPLISNFATFIMLNFVTGSTLIMDAHLHLVYLKDLVYAAVCFWLLPLVLVKLKEMKAAKSMAQEVRKT